MKKDENEGRMRCCYILTNGDTAEAFHPPSKTDPSSKRRKKNIANLQNGLDGTAKLLPDGLVQGHFSAFLVLRLRKKRNTNDASVVLNKIIKNTFVEYTDRLVSCNGTGSRYTVSWQGLAMAKPEGRIE